jgi:hypothetical protein
MDAGPTPSTTAVPAAASPASAGSTPGTPREPGISVVGATLSVAGSAAAVSSPVTVSALGTGAAARRRGARFGFCGVGAVGASGSGRVWDGRDSLTSVLTRQSGRSAAGFVLRLPLAALGGDTCAGRATNCQLWPDSSRGAGFRRAVPRANVRSQLSGRTDGRRGGADHIPWAVAPRRACKTTRQCTSRSTSCLRVRVGRTISRPGSGASVTGARLPRPWPASRRDRPRYSQTAA